MKTINYIAWMLTAFAAMYLTGSLFLQQNWQQATFFLIVFIFADIRMNRLYKDIDAESKREAGLDDGFRRQERRPPDL